MCFPHPLTQKKQKQSKVFFYNHTGEKVSQALSPLFLCEEFLQP